MQIFFHLASTKLQSNLLNSINKPRYFYTPTFLFVSASRKIEKSQIFILSLFSFFPLYKTIDPISQKFPRAFENVKNRSLKKSLIDHYERVQIHVYEGKNSLSFDD